MLKSIINRKLINGIAYCGIHTSSAYRLKEIIITKKGEETIFEGKVKESPRFNFLVSKTGDPEKDKACPICRHNLHVKHTDVLILSQFTDSTGYIMPREVTGLCLKQHLKMEILILMANSTGLLPGELPGNPPEKVPLKKYYDESLINVPLGYEPELEED